MKIKEIIEIISVENKIQQDFDMVMHTFE